MYTKNPLLKGWNLLAILITISFSAKAGSPKLVQNFNTQRPFTFEENKGQLADEKGNLLPDILYFGKDKGINVYCFKDKIAFVFTKLSAPQPPEGGEVAGSPFRVYPDHSGGLGGKFNSPFRGLGGDSTVVTASRIEMQLVNANPAAQVIAEQPQEAYSNYYLAHCPDGITAHSFNKLTYKNIYPAIDLVLSSNGKGMEYSFVVYPGGDVSNIRMRWNGADSMQYLQEQGVIRYANSLGSLEEGKLQSYLQGGQKAACSYKVQGNEVGFDVGEFDKGGVLVIDPVFSWSTYLGGAKDDVPSYIKTDNNHHIYIGGSTASTSGIATSGAYQTSLSGYSNAFISKFSENDLIIWSTYFGGELDDYTTDMALGRNNSLYITGTTESTKGIATTGTFQTSLSGSEDIFIEGFNTSGTRNWGTYFGGTSNEITYALAIDTSDNVYATCFTYSSGLATPGAYQTSNFGGGDVVLVKFDNKGTRQWSTYYGGNSDDYGYAMTTDLSGYIYNWKYAKYQPNCYFRCIQHLYSQWLWRCFYCKI